VRHALSRSDQRPIKSGSETKDQAHKKSGKRDLHTATTVNSEVPTARARTASSFGGGLFAELLHIPPVCRIHIDKIRQRSKLALGAVWSLLLLLQILLPLLPLFLLLLLLLPLLLAAFSFYFFFCLCFLFCFFHVIAREVNEETEKKVSLVPARKLRVEFLNESNRKQLLERSNNNLQGCFHTNVYIYIYILFIYIYIYI